MGGVQILPSVAKAMTGYSESDSDKVTECNKKASEKYWTYVYMEQADKSKYGSLLKNLHSQYSLKNNQFPTAMAAATSVLSNHKFDEPEKFKRDKLNKDGKEKDRKSTSEETETAPLLSFVQMEGRCYCCGKPGHKSPQCRHKDKPKDDWA
jgi:hypothetical protein